jgi:hypothetical protein
MYMYHSRHARNARCRHCTGDNAQYDFAQNSQPSVIQVQPPGQQLATLRHVRFMPCILCLVAVAERQLLKLVPAPQHTVIGDGVHVNKIAHYQLHMLLNIAQAHMPLIRTAQDTRGATMSWRNQILHRRGEGFDARSPHHSHTIHMRLHQLLSSTSLLHHSTLC